MTVPLWLHRTLYPVAFPLFTLASSFRMAGQRHMPRSGPVLIIANHTSYLDPILVGLAVRRPIRYLARKTLFRHPLFSALITNLGAVPIDQEGFAREGLQTSIRLLQGGEPLVVFPEGERTPHGQMIPFKPGVLLLLKKAPVPILPVGIAGAYEAFPLSASLPRWSPFMFGATGAGLAASVGPIIQPTKLEGMERERMLEALFDAVAEQKEAAERMRRK
ncbi:MAG: 1-acyl-sn-glycerol-3-phosphate acyltransferase [Gemmataceae bacterium]|nr:1-acyl-sn-glycerol-3-phosphate acyltransferase [Gemmataceae bacterium]